MTSFNRIWLTSLACFFFWQGYKWRISSLETAAKAVKAPLLPALWGVQRMSAHIFLLISAPGNYFPYPAILTSFPFSATCSQKAKIQSQGNIWDVLHPRTTLQHFVLGLQKEARQSPAWVSSLDEANKCHFVLPCATQAQTEGGKGRSSQTHDLKAGGWFDDWMSRGLHFQLMLTQSIMHRESQNHGIFQAGKYLQIIDFDSSPRTARATTKPSPQVPYLHGF